MMLNGIEEAMQWNKILLLKIVHVEERFFFFFFFLLFIMRKKKINSNITCHEWIKLKQPCHST